MTCAEFLELAEGYALGALDPAEQRAAEAHLALANHQGCLQTLARAESAALALATSLPLERPDPRSWKAIQARISTRAAPARRERALWAAALAASLVFAAVVGNELHRLRSRPAAPEGAADALAILRSPQSRMVTLAAQAGFNGRAQAVIDLSQSRGLVVAGPLPPRPGSDYQLWLIRGAQKISAGLLRDGLARIEPALLAGGPPDALAVSLEPAGGSPQPTGPIVLAGAVPKV